MSGTAADRLALVGRLAILARALEARGAYNGGKLLRAAMDAELTRLALAEATTDEELLGSLEQVTELLAESGTGRGVAARLPAVIAAVRDDGIVSLEAAPRSHVCRMCGELFLGDPPVACPTCEAPATAFREHVPTWFLEPMAPADVLDELAVGAARVAAVIGGRDDESLARVPQPGEWSARDTLDHLLGTEAILAGRIARMLTEDEPDVAAVTVGDVGPPSDEGPGASAAAASRLLAEFLAAREGTIARLKALGDNDWNRSGRHPEWGRVTIRSQAAYFARHQASHAAQLAAAAEGRVPGQRLPGR
ncbi:MAG TPA: DinB family protein [Candidatus Limnocylindrales bacterium]